MYGNADVPGLFIFLNFEIVLWIYIRKGERENQPARYNFPYV